MNKQEQVLNVIPELVNAIALPNYDIISVFRKDSGSLITLKGNFEFFVKKQCAINAPGEVLTAVNLWLTGKVRAGRFEWDGTGGVCLGDDYIFENSSFLDERIIK